MNPELRVDGSQLLADLEALSHFGRAEGGGWTRPALGEADAAARRYVIDRMRALGLELRRDEVGNLRARLPGRDESAAPVASGSHLDSVPSGGRLDGPLGVVGALAAVEAIRRASPAPRRSIEVWVFVGEEGSRFPRGTLGSAAASGEIPVADILALRDAGGVSYGEALATYGDDSLLGGAPLPARVAPGEMHAFLELHVEQGGILEAERVPIGAVTAIAGLVQRSITFTGDANHAGATPMGALRRDALLAAAEWALAVERAALEVGGGAVATVGKLEVHPGGKNIIPGRVEAICDLRAPTGALLDELDRRVVESLEASSPRHVAVQHKRLQRVHPGAMHELAIRAVESAAADLGMASRRMLSGAIHDALHVAEVAPASMVFVPSRGGKSHCPEEDTEPAQLVDGARVLAQALWRLAQG